MIENSPIEVSVVVPVRDEADSIRDLINGLLKQTFAPREILLTDGGSRDATISIIEEFIKGGAPIKLFREHDSLPGHARNVGAAHASCEWLAFIDAGTIPQADWLEWLVAKATSPRPTPFSANARSLLICRRQRKSKVDSSRRVQSRRP
jgi:glycosyltransferase involved in cell wall biosynthesis